MILKSLIQVSLIHHFYSVTQITMIFHGLDELQKMVIYSVVMKLILKRQIH